MSEIFDNFFWMFDKMKENNTIFFAVLVVFLLIMWVLIFGSDNSALVKLEDKKDVAPEWPKCVTDEYWYTTCEE